MREVKGEFVRADPLVQPAHRVTVPNGRTTQHIIRNLFILQSRAAEDKMQTIDLEQFFPLFLYDFL